MMVVGKQFDDATVLRVARAVEDEAGGFPRLPGHEETT
jgi:amidase